MKRGLREIGHRKRVEKKKGGREKERGGRKERKKRYTERL